MDEKDFGRVEVVCFFKQGFNHFVLHVKCRRRGLEVKWPFDLHWLEELLFGQEPVLLEESIFKASPAA